MMVLLSLMSGITIKAQFNTVGRLYNHPANKTKNPQETNASPLVDNLMLKDSLKNVSSYKNVVNSNNVFVEFVDIPFHSELFNDLFIIHNEKPDRPITYEILDEYGDVLIAGNVSKENSVQITLSVSDLPDNGIYTIVLTSPNPNDRVWSQFEK